MPATDDDNPSPPPPEPPPVQQQQPPPSFSQQDFRWGRLLGEGSYARVLHAELKANRKHYAIKVMEKRHIRRENKVQQVLREKTVLSKLAAVAVRGGGGGGQQGGGERIESFVVKLWFTFQDAENLYLVLDLCVGRDLLHLINRHKEAHAQGQAQAQAHTHTHSSTKGCPEEMARFYAGEIVMALEFLHSEGVVHRDLKPENVLLGSRGHIKLTDFGSALLLSSPAEQLQEQEIHTDTHSHTHTHTQEAKSFVGTAEYVSPEVLANEPATAAVDLWALGCLLYQLLTGEPPFKGESDYLIFQAIMQHCSGVEPLAFPPPPPFPAQGQAHTHTHLHTHAQDLVAKLLVRRPEERLGATTTATAGGGYEALKAHVFFEGFGWEAVLAGPAPYLPEERMVEELMGEEMRDGRMEEEDWLSLEEAVEGAEVMILEQMVEQEPQQEHEEGGGEGGEEKWSRYLDEANGERCLFSGLVWKKSGLLSHTKRRQLLITNKQRLVYLDPKTGEMKGEIVCAVAGGGGGGDGGERGAAAGGASLRLQVKGEHAFDITTPQRTHHFMDEGRGAEWWVEAIKEVMGERAIVVSGTSTPTPASPSPHSSSSSRKARSRSPSPSPSPSPSRRALSSYLGV
jgi:3-phosphoinositide dependent protein kinase-1